MTDMNWFPQHDGDGPDEQVGAWLGEIDPGRDSATYWMRFHRGTVEAAAFELARRRRAAQRTVTGVVSSWSRAVVSAALVAAAAAGLFLAQPGAFTGGPVEVGEAPALVEDVLSLGLTQVEPEVFGPEDDEDGALRFASEVF